MRFKSPPRETVSAAVFEHPLFDEYQRWSAWLRSADWPDLASIDAQLQAVCQAAGLPQRSLVEQDAVLSAEQLHYELRIDQQGSIATRPRNWHDLFNALIWLRHPQIKHALNQRQVADIHRVGSKQRTRGQCALTQFDEAGAVVILRDIARIKAWDRHNWVQVFADLQSEEVAVAVIGHALLEHGLDPQRLLVGKAIVLRGEHPARQLAEAVAAVAQGIALGQLLNDPSEMRPFPLMGLPLWHARAGENSFLAEAECFQPVRAGRVYPAPLQLSAEGVLIEV